eukprot:373865_1
MSLLCGMSLPEQQLTYSDPVAYYKLNITTEDSPVIISYSNSSIKPYIYLIKYTSLSHQFLQTSHAVNDYFQPQVILNDIGDEEYYVVIQEYANEVGTYSISVTCPPTNSPTFDEQTDRVCVTGSLLSSINGMYKYDSWDSSVNSIVYYNEANQLFLSPYIDQLSSFRGYQIGDNMTEAYCNIRNSTLTTTINVIECFDSWIVNNGSLFINDLNMRLVRCTDMCFSGNYRSWLDGTYRWYKFNTMLNASIYFFVNSLSALYLFPMLNSKAEYKWVIGNDYTTARGYSYCLVENVLNLNLPENCFTWYSYNSSNWILDDTMSGVRCTTPSPTNAPNAQESISARICVSGSSVNGVYKNLGRNYFIFVHFYINAKTNRYLYYSFNNSEVNGMYEYQIIITTTDASNKSGEMYCTVYSTTDNYLFNPNDCSYKWKYWNGSQSDMISVNCDDICVSGFHHAEHNGVYQWLRFNKKFNGSVYLCRNCEADYDVYLFPWIDNGDYYWTIANDSTTLVLPHIGFPYGFCQIPWTSITLHSSYTFDVKDCSFWISYYSSSWWLDEEATVTRCLTQSPTNEPTQEPTELPTKEPTEEPTELPTSPTTEPTLLPTLKPTLSPTLPYSFPIDKSEFNVTDNYQNISCDQILSNQSNSAQSLVSYYKFNVPDTKHPDIQQQYITTCDGNSSYDTYMYIIRDYGTNAFVIEKEAANALCDAFSSQLDITLLSDGIYYVVIQGYKNTVGDFSIRMICENPSPKVSKQLVMSLVFGTFCCMLLIFIIYYVYEWKQYFTNKEISPHEHVATFSHIPGDETQEHSADSIELVGINTTEKGRVEHGHLEDEKDLYDKASDKLSDHISGDHLSIRRIETDRAFAEQLNKNEDAIQLLLKHAIQCCQDQSGFDMYQVLAVRYYDEASRITTSIKPLRKFGINIEFIMLSSCFRAAFTVVIIALTQTFGISVVVYKLIVGYFKDENDDVLCVMESQRWRDVFSLKMLSFLLSLTVSFFIVMMLEGIQHNGLYEMMETLSLKHMKRVNNISLFLIQIGQ